MKYLLKYKIKGKGKSLESDLFLNLSGAFNEWALIQKIHGDAIKVAVILRDSEGEDCLENSGKYFLYRILK